MCFAFIFILVSKLSIACGEKYSIPSQVLGEIERYPRGQRHPSRRKATAPARRHRAPRVGPGTLPAGWDRMMEGNVDSFMVQKKCVHFDVCHIKQNMENKFGKFITFYWNKFPQTRLCGHFSPE